MTDSNTESPTTPEINDINMTVDNSSTPAGQASQHPPEASLEFPTREFLDKKFRKPDLQKQCRELGITNIWTSKKNLIDMILYKSPPLPSSSETTQQNTTSSDVTQPSSPSTEITHTPLHNGITEMNIQEITKSIKIIMSKLEVKDKEIDLLNTEMKTAYATIEVLQKRVTELEQRDSNEKHHVSVVTPTLTTNSLLLGDSNLRHILCSDLDKNCQIKTITGANMDLLRSWVNEKLTQTPSICVIYNGINDILEEELPATILDNLGSLISELKEKNNAMKIYVCQVVPTPMTQENLTKIEDYNELLVKWGETNGIEIIKTVSTFRLGTGELDDLSFSKEEEEDSGFTLNRLGAIKLLSTIKKQCPDFHLCAKWNEVKNSWNTYKVQRADRRRVDQDNSRRFFNSFTHAASFNAYEPRDLRAPSYVNIMPTQRGVSEASNTPTWRAPSRAFSTSTQGALPRPRPAPPLRTSPHLSPEGMTARQDEAGRDNVRRGYSNNTYASALRRMPEEETRTTYSNLRTGLENRSRPPSPHNHTPTQSFGRRDTHINHTQYGQRSYSNSYNSELYNRKKIGCFNCGEFNHVQTNCRFDHKVLCTICQRVGHKSRLCGYYTA